MTCFVDGETLSAFADRELDATLWATIHDHVQSCTECQTQLQAIATIDTAMQQWMATILLPESFDDRLRQRVAMVRQKHHLRVLLLVMAFLTVFILLGLIVLWQSTWGSVLQTFLVGWMPTLTIGSWLSSLWGYAGNVWVIVYGGVFALIALFGLRWLLIRSKCEVTS